ncbi:MAG: hypothetical protein AAGK92_12430 [Pseudomonadota bacterium]
MPAKYRLRGDVVMGGKILFHHQGDWNRIRPDHLTTWKPTAAIGPVGRRRQEHLALGLNRVPPMAQVFDPRSDCSEGIDTIGQSIKRVEIVARHGWVDKRANHVVMLVGEKAGGMFQPVFHNRTGDAQNAHRVWVGIEREKIASADRAGRQA